MNIIFSWQAVTHFPQPSQALENAGSANAQGGRKSGFFPRQSPRKNCALEIEFIAARNPKRVLSFFTKGILIADQYFDLYQFIT
jgi:hypothetical protein